MKLSLSTLAPPKEPFEIVLVPGITVKVNPPTSLSKTIAEAAANRIVDGIEDSLEICVEAGFAEPSLVDFSDEDFRKGLYQQVLIRELAVGHIISWSGIIDDKTEEPVEVSPDKVRAIMDIPPLGETFFSKLMAHQIKVFAAKKDSGVTAPGTSKKAVAPNTAKDAENKASTAPKEKKD